MKKFLSVFLALSLLLTLCPVFTLNTAAATAADFTYEILEDGTIEITGYTGTQTDVIIPNRINSVDVTAVADAAFEGSRTLQYITIPSTVKHIGKRAFYGCLSLEMVYFIDSRLTDIGDYAFADCPSLAFIRIPDKVTSIGAYAICAFNAYNPDDPDEMMLDDTLPVWVTEGTYGEQYALENGLRVIYNIYNKGDFYATLKDDDTAEIIKYTGSDATVTVPSSFGDNVVSSIGITAFVNNNTLQNVILPESVTEIGDLAFMNCENLHDVTLPDGLERIGAHAFINCTSLTGMILPYNTTIGSYALGFNSTNGYAVNPDFTAYVYEYSPAQEYCDANQISYDLRYFTSGNYQYSLYYGVCAFITKYTGSESDVTVPNTLDGALVYSIGEKAFTGKARMTYVTLPKSVEIIDAYAFNNCFSLSEVSAPGVQIIGQHAFENCWSLESIDLPSATAIGGFAFYKCSNLTNVQLPLGLQFIGYMAFGNCDELNELTIPYGVAEIRDFAVGWSEDSVDPDRIIRNTKLTINLFKGSEAEDYAKRYAEYYNLEYTFNHNYMGDVDGDGKVNVNDVTALQRALADYTTLDALATTLADVNSDQSVNIDDITDLQWLIAYTY